MSERLADDEIKRASISMIEALLFVLKLRLELTNDLAIITGREVLQYGETDVVR